MSDLQQVEGEELVGTFPSPPSSQTNRAPRPVVPVADSGPEKLGQKLTAGFMLDAVAWLYFYELSLRPSALREHLNYRQNEKQRKGKARDPIVAKLKHVKTSLADMRRVPPQGRHLGGPSAAGPARPPIWGPA